MLNRWLMLAPVALLLGLTTLVRGAPILIIDQQNGVGPASSFVGQNRIGQSFVPSLAGIDAIEFVLGVNRGGNTVFVNLREGLAGPDGLDGPIIGTSNSLELPGNATFETRHFDFPSRIELVPGNVYVAELIGRNGHAVRISINDQYPAGAALPLQSFGVGWDVAFMEGLHVPEPQAIAFIPVAAVVLTLVSSGRRRRVRQI